MDIAVFGRNSGYLFEYQHQEGVEPLKVNSIQIAKASNHDSGRMRIYTSGKEADKAMFYELVSETLRAFGVTGLSDRDPMLFDVAFGGEPDFISTVMNMAIKLLYATDTGDSKWVMDYHIRQIFQTLYLHHWNAWQEMRWVDPEKMILAEHGFISLYDAMTGSMFVRGLDYPHIPN